MQRDDYRDDLPVSRGQWRAIATALVKQAGEAVPASRYQATVLLARLSEAHRADRAAPAAAGDAQRRGRAA